MKRKVLGIMIVAILVAMAFTSYVSAAGVAVSPATVKSGDNVTVTVKTDKKVYGMEFTLTYDADKFEYVSNANGSTVNANNAGVIKVSHSSAAELDTLTFTFKAKADGTASFDLSSALFFDEDGLEVSEAVATPSASVTIEKATTSTDNDSEEKDNGKKPDGIPQAGTNTAVYVGAGLAIIAVAAMVVSRKK